MPSIQCVRNKNLSRTQKQHPASKCSMYKVVGNGPSFGLSLSSSRLRVIKFATTRVNQNPNSHEVANFILTEHSHSFAMQRSSFTFYVTEEMRSICICICATTNVQSILRNGEASRVIFKQRGKQTVTEPTSMHCSHYDNTRTIGENNVTESNGYSGRYLTSQLASALRSV